MNDPRPHPGQLNSARSFIVWGVGVGAYVVAVLQRTTLGVSGVEAAERFHVTASALSSLAVVQLIVYAALQVPVGVLLDRLGPRAMIALGGVLMALGQLILAFAPDITQAVIGRLLVGAGDAFTFISVIRLLPAWFEGQTLPQVSQWTGNLGQIGQILSAVPFSLLLHTTAWTPAFTVVAAVSILAAVAVVLFVSDTPAGAASSAAPPSWRQAMSSLRVSFMRPGTRLGFWAHFVTQSSGTMITLLWGFPMLTGGLGYSRAVASGLLIVIVAVGACTGPVLGILTARFPMRRSNIVLGIVMALGIAWTLVLSWPVRPPFVAVLGLFVVLGAGAPGSLIGFDFARTFNPLGNQGSANGIVNVGGFLASFVMMFLVGVVLDFIDRTRVAGGHPSDVFAWESFRVAFLVQYVIVGAGVVGVLVERRRTRAMLIDKDGVTFTPLWSAVLKYFPRRSREK